MSSSAGDILIVGSVPLENAQAVFRAVGGILGERVESIPDGETGPRLHWIEWQTHVFDVNPMFELVRSADEFDWRNKNVASAWKTKPWYALRPDADAGKLAFGALGYAEAAKDSFAVFSRCKSEGTVHATCKFQVSLPTPYNVIDQRVAPAHRLAVEGPYEARMRQEIAEIAAAIPHGELAIQWDVAHEVQNLDGGRPHWFDDPERRIIERLGRLGNSVPADIELGFHLCYGDFAHRHFIEPKDTGLMVRLSNSLAQSIKRPIEWIHMPVPRNRTDDAYFAPLSALKLPPRTRLFLGLVHFSDGIDGGRARLAAAKKVVADFGVATECGFGRRDPSTIDDLLHLHAAVADINRA
jgi:hypothetical protein